MIHVGHVLDTLKQIPDNSVHCCWTSPPYYGLRNYGTPPQIWDDTSDYSVHYHTFDKNGFCACGAWEGHLGLEPTPELYVKHLTDIFREVRRTLHPTGVCWLNLGDSYNTNRSGKQSNLKSKDLIGTPWMAAFALRSDGWYLRSECIWAKGLSFCEGYVGSVLPDGAQDRPSKSHETLFMLTKNAKYFYDIHAVQEDSKTKPHAPGNKHGDSHMTDAHSFERGRSGHALKPQKIWGAGMKRNIRSVWTIPVKPFAGAHFAVAPTALVEPCIKAGSSSHGVCSACGNPWVRVITKSKPSTEAYKLVGGNNEGNYTGQATKPYTGSRAQNASDTKRRILERMNVVSTTSWKASCGCNAPVKPAVVLDPFFGAGTTGIVAQRNGREIIGCELNQEFADMAQVRLDDDEPLTRLQKESA